MGSLFAWFCLQTNLGFPLGENQVSRSKRSLFALKQLKDQSKGTMVGFVFSCRVPYLIFFSETNKVTRLFAERASQ